MITPGSFIISGLTFGLYDSMHDQVTKLKTHFQEWFEPRQHIIFPQPLNNIRKVSYTNMYYFIILLPIYLLFFNSIEIKSGMKSLNFDTYLYDVGMAT
jgi:hypothetical protein